MSEPPKRSRTSTILFAAVVIVAIITAAEGWRYITWLVGLR